MSKYKTEARIFGIFFILAFFSYGIGSALIDSVVTTPDFLSSVYANQIKIVIGVVLISLIHSFVNIGLPVIVLPVLKPFNKYLTYGYLSAAISATTILAVGTILLLLLIPLSAEYVKASSAELATLETIGLLLKKGGYFAYHMGMALWSIGGLLFVSILYKSRLIPRLMSIWGLIGYFVLLSGSILLLLEHSSIIEIGSVIPGGLFEITLSIWLLFKGFNQSVIISELP
jgi:hypothetical protein